MRYNPQSILSLLSLMILKSSRILCQFAHRYLSSFIAFIHMCLKLLIHHLYQLHIIAPYKKKPFQIIGKKCYLLISRSGEIIFFMVSLTFSLSIKTQAHISLLCFLICSSVIIASLSNLNSYSIFNSGIFCSILSRNSALPFMDSE